jgi:hypothetical protein
MSCFSVSFVRMSGGSFAFDEQPVHEAHRRESRFAPTVEPEATGRAVPGIWIVIVFERAFRIEAIIP